MNDHTIDLDRVLELRLLVARFGEMDVAKWWNTRGQLGPLGAAALRRGFPRTHRFAQARSVFAVAAAHRCGEVFEPPGCVTKTKREGSDPTNWYTYPRYGDRLFRSSTLGW